MNAKDETPLTPTRLTELQDLFGQALGMPFAERDGFLTGLADQNLALRVRRLLVAHERTGPALQSPLPGAASRIHGAGHDPWLGARLGSYEIERRIGEGGMGTVYAGIRVDAEYQQSVAIKLLRQQASSESMRQRFRDERQILATLQHPNIAVLLDGGVTPDDQPYFVMEYLDGDAITHWCDARRLSVADRLVLFEQVCAAVHYAHQSLVVHRDLKPGNIFVTADGVVKLLDFGIAKLLRTDTGSEEESVTQVGARAYTPDYASPEQLLGRAVGTRSDVYSLGVVLHELVTGARPFALAGKSAGEVERLVSETPPAPPSTMLPLEHADRLGERTHARAVARIAGDLDAIILKAIRKEPERRYGSVEELAADLRRLREGRPVTARPDSVAYRFGKLVRRRKGEAVGITLATTFLLAGAVATAVQTREAIRGRERVSQVKEFLTTMLGAARPGAFGKDVQMRTVLDSAALRADAMRGQPALEAEIRDIIGGTYLALGEFELAEEQYRRALALTQATSPNGSRAVALAYSQVGAVLEFAGRYAEADSVEQLATRQYDQFGFPDVLARAAHLDLRGRLLVRLGQMAEAEPLLAEALALQLKATPTNDSATVEAYANLGMVRSELGQNASAETLFVHAVAAARRAYGDVHPLVAAVLSPLATVQERAGEIERADSTFRATLAMREQLLGPEHPDYAWTMFSYADHLLLMGRNAEAAEWSRKVLALRGRSLSDAHPAVATAMSVLGRALGRMDSLAAGERWLRESWRLRKENLPEGHFLIASSQSILGAHLVLARRFLEAERNLLEGEAALVEARGESAPIIQDARKRLVQLYEAWLKPDEAATWRSRLQVSASASP